ncbi:hypothetical protein I5M27_00515 [Adhaeribacter sp. BT258]|uniref:Uncharacterized protein n=1 Tax=Adhaeribacter terrigena TaxID=2793070 RepID=A0ABS1BWD9_9BACT|nr:hypothetical protein [Adhaeribacter terrigena]MBK0401442.1 hypothetical protein [Adhaeribacter terrigena]
MKSIMIFISFLLISFNCIAQNPIIRTDFDTIKVFHEKTLVHYRTYQDSLLVEEAQAFLFPITLKIPRFRLLLGIFKVEVETDSIVFHGSRKSFLSDRSYKVEEYENGQLLNTGYFDSSGLEISKALFYSHSNFKGPCVEYGSHFFLKGRKN